MTKFKIRKIKREGTAFKERLYYVCFAYLHFDEVITEICIEKTYSKFYEELDKENCDIRNVRGWLCKTSLLLAKEYK